MDKAITVLMTVYQSASNGPRLEVFALVTLWEEASVGGPLGRFYDNC